MAATDFDVLVVGAGAAGLTVMRELAHAGLKTLCLEARDRIGGRILTVYDPLSPIPIELGPEFIHGRPEEIWEIARSAPLAVYSCFERAIHLRAGQPQGGEDAWLLAHDVLEDMRKTAEHGPDQTFADFLEQSAHSEQAKQLATSYVEGFNAARKEIIGISSLALDAAAADAIDGDASFRILNGYHAVARYIAAGIENPALNLRLQTVVNRIEWRAGLVTAYFQTGPAKRAETVTAKKVVITVPLGVLQAGVDNAGAIRFDPEPADTLSAAQQLSVGSVMRVVLRFRKAFWEDGERLGDFGFLLSDEKFFPTWWTPLPIRAPILTGWSAGPHADRLIGRSQDDIVMVALRDLARILDTNLEIISGLVEKANFHDWSADPFARGAYSYVPVNALPARNILARPIADTLFFAGEATELNGHSATVHGAMASGKRAVQQLLQLQP